MVRFIVPPTQVNKHHQHKVWLTPKDDYSKIVGGMSNRGLAGSDNHNWKGGRYISHGYVRILNPNHPRADNRGYIFEHIVMERKLGRFLNPGERVHHINHNKQDNRPKNLELMRFHSQHMVTHPASRRRFGSPYVVRNGHHNGEQYFRCNTCKRLFTAYGNLIKNYSREFLDVAVMM